MVDFGNSAWRRTLYDDWDLLRMSIAEIVPSARWWLWGSLVTARAEPLFGELATLDAAVIVPVGELPVNPGRLGLLMSSIRSAEELHRVDVHSPVFEVMADDPRRVVTELTFEKLRQRASRTIVDDESRTLVDAGYVEVLP